MVELNDKDLFAIFEKQLRLFYPSFKNKQLSIKYIFDLFYASYNYVERKLHFNNYILYFQFEGDCLRKFSYQEALRMIKREYPESKVKLKLYIDNDRNDINDESKFHEIVEFHCDVDIDDVQLNKEQLSSMIDLAFDTRTERCNNEEWITELSLKYKAFMKNNS
ncbi:hypothetical protein [Paenibacillus taichungensis]